MLKRINNWHLSILVIIVSVLSVFLLEHYALAQWTDPVALPGENNLTSIVLNPMVQDLNLNGFSIFDDNLLIDGRADDVISVANGGAICLNESGCITDWAEAGGASDLWRGSLTGDIYNANSGYVGIGTDTPNRYLHIKSAPDALPDALNAELDIQSGDNDYWAIYNDKDTNDLRFWNNNVPGDKNAITIANNGNVGLGTLFPVANLDVDAVAKPAIVGRASGGFPAVRGVNTAPGTADSSYLGQSVGVVGDAYWGVVGIGRMDGVYNESIGVYGMGNKAVRGMGAYGIYGEAVSGTYGDAVAGVYGRQGWGDAAGIFEGNLKVTRQTIAPTSPVYLQMDVLADTQSAPPAADCNEESEKGRMLYDWKNARLYICGREYGAAEAWYYVSLTKL